MPKKRYRPPSPLHNPRVLTLSQFELAAEETEKKTVYAADDRAAAQEEVNKANEAYKAALARSRPDVAAEIKGRVGQRIRELQIAMENLERSATEE
ncbi:MAG: hypothetical protein Q9227_001260 [Pyrenula ochraceoflavens]